MWDDVDKNSPLIIPVANINIISGGVPNPSQWNDVPVLFDIFTGTAIMISQDLTEIKIATNLTHDILYFKIKSSSNIDMTTGATDFVILFASDYNCSGKKIILSWNMYSIFNLCDVNAVPGTNYVQPVLYASGTGPNIFVEFFINLKATGLNLPKNFMVSVYSTGTAFPLSPNKSSRFRWVKFSD